MNDVLANVNIPIISTDEIETSIVFPPDAIVRAPSGDGRATGASVDAIIVEGGRVMVEVESMKVGNDDMVEGEPIGATVELGVVTDSGEGAAVMVVVVVAVVTAVTVVVDEEESSMSMADTPLHSSKACAHGSRHDAHSSDSSSNSLFGGKKEWW